MSFPLIAIYSILVFLNEIATNMSFPISGSAENSTTKTPSTNTIANLEVPTPKILKFMRRFGYLDVNRSELEAESLYHEAAIKDAIRNIQKYGALDETGILNNATLKLLTTPRCGVPDIETGGRTKRYIIGGRSWTKRRLKYFIANWSIKIPQENIVRDLNKAFSLWSQYSRLIFERVNETSADIIIGFGTQYHGDSYPFDGPGNILAHAYYPYEMGSWGGDVHFDEDENWKENSTNLEDGVDFYSVAVHELGHSLGLAHSPIYSSIMFPYYKGQAQSSLDYDDILAMYDLYIRKSLDEDEVKKPFEPTNDDFSTTEEIELEKSTTIRDDTVLISTVTTTLNEVSEAITFSRSSSTTSTIRPVKSNIPNICKGDFDAVTEIDGSVFIFKSLYVWKLTAKYTVVDGYPRLIHKHFPLLPREQRIDAVYVRFDEAIVFFTGDMLWVYKGTTIIEGSPKPLSSFFGSLVNISKVDAAMVWPKNNCTYIFAGSKFWRFDDRTKMFNLNYPKSMKRWPGIPDHIDAATTLANGKTYFFKENIYWLYNNQYLRPQRGYPRRISRAWLGCSTSSKVPLRNLNTTISFI